MGSVRQAKNKARGEQTKQIVREKKRAFALPSATVNRTGNLAARDGARQKETIDTRKT